MAIYEGERGEERREKREMGSRKENRRCQDFPLMYVPPRLGNQGIDLMRILLLQTRSVKYKEKEIDDAKTSLGEPRDRSYEIIATKQSEKYKCKNIFPTSSNIAIHVENGEVDFDVSVVRLQTCLTDILGFLEKFEGGFEQDIDDDGEKDKEDE
ncbi:hypothetical protein Tco_1184690 [Tanacetum coccineum]